MKLSILQPAAAVAVVGSETQSNCKAKQKLLPTQTACKHLSECCSLFERNGALVHQRKS
jgi:hypothetical protein